MKVSEKSLELNIGAELLAKLRGPLGMPKAYLRGLTQKEERQEGVDFFVNLAPGTRIFAFQFKAPLGRYEKAPYRYTLKRQQHGALFQLATASPRAVFYVFPFYVTPEKLYEHVPSLAQDTWLLDVAEMDPTEVFGSNKTKVVRCQQDHAQVNPKFDMLSLANLSKDAVRGIPSEEFAGWHEMLRRSLAESRGHRNPWLVRGLRIAVVRPSENSDV